MRDHRFRIRCNLY